MLSNPQRLTYRPEIDGLRAIAVGGVVLFHAGLGVTGGFVGVDVFFVISGFLITSIVAQELSTDQFTLREFWARRIRRILPASTLVVLCVMIASVLLLAPSDIERVMRSSFWQTLLVANFYFERQFGYFAHQAEMQPLLHTWSLAVEEQFYIVFPAMLVLYRRYVDKNFLPLVVALAIASLLISIWQTSKDSSAAFFLLPARAWELLAGAGLALLPGHGLRGRFAAELITAIGLGAIAAAMLFYDSQTPFPGWAATLPVFGAMAIIAGCTNCETVVSKLLSTRPLVWIGRRSYSIYLWHWPLCAFASLLLIEVGMGTRIVLVVCSVLLSMLSFNLVEQPFRCSSTLKQPSMAFRFAGALVIPMAVCSFVVLTADGFPSLASDSTRTLDQDVTWKGAEYLGSPERTVSIGREAGDDHSPDFILWGDSHLLVATPVFDEVARRLDLCGEVLAKTGIPPVPGVQWRGAPAGATDSASMIAYNETIAELILRKKPRGVIIVSRWAVWCSGRSDLEVRNGRTKHDVLVAKQPGSPADPQAAAEALRASLRELFTRFTDAGISVWVLQQVPECDTTAPARDFLKRHTSPSLNSLANNRTSSVTLADHNDRQALARWALSVADEFPDVHLIDSSARFFDEKDALLTHDQRSYYRDDNHLTRAGAERFLTPCVGEMLGEIVAQKSDASSPSVRTATRAHSAH